jgi:hypothetical protein
MERKDELRNSTPASKPGRFLIALLLMVTILANLVDAASVKDAVRNTGSRISNYFNSYASSTGPSFLDFLVFSVIFIAVCWIGFSQVFKEAKGANVALSVAVGFALSVALVYGGKVTLKKLLPFAGVVLVILGFIGLYALLSKFVFTKGTAGSKILAFIFALIITIVIVSLLWSAICNNNRCEGNAFAKKLFGSESAIGKWFKGAGSIFEGGTTLTPSTQPKKVAGTVCGNGKQEAGEACDPGGTGDTKATGCPDNYLCDSCKRCLQDSTAGIIFGNLSNNKMLYLGLLLLLLLLGLGVGKRKSIKEGISNWRQRRGKKRELKTLARLLRATEQNEKRVLENFRQLCNSIKSEKGVFDRNRKIVDRITTDIKDTIGGELELIKTAEVSEGGTVSHTLDQLLAFNNTELHIINGADGIIHNMKEQLEKISQVPEELRKEIDTLQNIDTHFREHNELLESFRQHNFREANIISNMQARILDNQKDFGALSDSCNNMLSILRAMQNDIPADKAGTKIDYATLVGHIKGLRDHAIKLNSIFSGKVSLLHTLVQKLTDLKAFVNQLHEEERQNVYYFLEQALRAEKENPDAAVYLATHVLENAELLDKSDLDPGSKAELQKMASEAKRIIKECLPKLFESLKPGIQDELNNGEFDKVKQLVSAAGTLEFLNEKYGMEFGDLIEKYEHKMELLDQLCDELRGSIEARTALYNALGLNYGDIKWTIK